MRRWSFEGNGEYTNSANVLVHFLVTLMNLRLQTPNQNDEISWDDIAEFDKRFAHELS